MINCPRGQKKESLNLSLSLVQLKNKMENFKHPQNSTNKNKKILTFRNIIIGTVLILFVLLSVIGGIFLYNPAKISSVKPGNININEISPVSFNTSKIFFMQQSGKDHTLFTMNPDGSELKLSCKKHFNNYEVKFSPDGKWLTYYDDKTEEIVVMKSDESQVKKIPMEFGLSPAISPDGQKLVYTVFDENLYYTIHSIDLLSQDQETKLLSTGFFSKALISDIQFTPDGEFIVLKVSQNKTDVLCLIDAESCEFIRTITTKAHYNIISYVISSDAATIYFITSESIFGAVYKLAMDGSEDLEVLHEIKRERLENLTISPDDKYLLFAAQFYDSSSNVAGDLFLKKLEIETREIKNLKDIEGNDVIGVPLLWT